MDSRKKIKRYALVSLYNKAKISYLCRNLIKYNICFITTGSTYKKIISLGFKCQKLSNLTKFKEILDGRVKTIHPKIHASLLYKRDNKKHLETFNKMNFPQIDFVIVNLYPFKKTLSTSSDENKINDMIDIGGPLMIRSAAKNFKFVTTICDTLSYKDLITNLKKNNGETNLVFRKKMASKVFKLMSEYDNVVYKWLS